MVSANSSTSAGGLASAAMGMRPTRNGASQAMTLQVGVHQAWPTDGRCTLTTTSSPVCSVAAWTWAIEAAASGRAVELGEHRLEAVRPSSRLDDRRTASPGLGRHLVAALLELGDELLGEEALAAAR